MFGARPIRRWLQKNVMTMLSKMLVKGEASEGSTICIEATDDKEGLEYEVVKKVADSQSQRGGMERSNDSDSASTNLVVVTHIPNSLKASDTLEKGNEAFARRFSDYWCEMTSARRQNAMSCAPRPS
jgi:hypothetical protein